MTASPSSGSRTYCFIRNSNDDNDGNTFPPFYHSMQIVCELQFIDLSDGIWNLGVWKVSRRCLKVSGRCLGCINTKHCSKNPHFSHIFDSLWPSHIYGPLHFRIGTSNTMCLEESGLCLRVFDWCVGGKNVKSIAERGHEIIKFTLHRFFLYLQMR